uniref:Mitochondrial resolvase Ydc2 catalytic domain-containing protein n=1 Tax=viral metagenome TaxID=1070528 RepID=A0A6C0IHJ9_9ZZZZ
MRIISIDVGIKNLAYCILESKENNSYNIIQWDVINLCGEEHVCNCALKQKESKKSKKIGVIVNTILCNKKASYTKVINGIMNYYCQTHAKQSGFLLPNASLKKIKSWKRDALLSYALEKGIVFEENSKKDVLIKSINDFLKDKVLEKTSSVSANDMTLIQMGIKIVSEFDLVLANNLLTIDQIVIENQISPIANRMKTLQGMIAQYFIMRGKPTISFISSANKLKLFSENKSTSYSERKKEGVKIVKELLDKGTIIDNGIWSHTFLTHKKKDDLADAFLQGAWFLSSKK